LGIFTLASAMCGAAQSLGELIAARVLQGIGGGMLTPTAPRCCSAPSRPSVVRGSRGCWSCQS